MRVVLLCLACVAAAAAPDSSSAWTWPVAGPVLEQFKLGDDPYAGGQHRGIDVGAADGENVLAPAAGRVAFAGSVPGGGRTVTIATPHGLSVTLVHLGSYTVRRDDTIAEGAVVGAAAALPGGEWPQPYVHLGVRRADDPHGYIDPLTLLPSREHVPAEPAPQSPAIAGAAPAPAPGSGVVGAEPTPAATEAVAPAGPTPVTPAPVSVPAAATAVVAPAVPVPATSVPPPIEGAPAPQPPVPHSVASAPASSSATPAGSPPVPAAPAVVGAGNAVATVVPEEPASPVEPPAVPVTALPQGADAQPGPAAGPLVEPAEVDGPAGGEAAANADAGHTEPSVGVPDDRSPSTVPAAAASASDPLSGTVSWKPRGQRQATAVALPPRGGVRVAGPRHSISDGVAAAAGRQAVGGRAGNRAGRSRRRVAVPLAPVSVRTPGGIGVPAVAPRVGTGPPLPWRLVALALACVLLAGVAGVPVRIRPPRRRTAFAVREGWVAEGAPEPRGRATDRRCAARPTRRPPGRACGQRIAVDPFAELLRPPRRRPAPPPAFRGRRGRRLSRLHATRSAMRNVAV